MTDRPGERPRRPLSIWWFIGVAMALGVLLPVSCSALFLGEPAPEGEPLRPGELDLCHRASRSLGDDGMRPDPVQGGLEDHVDSADLASPPPMDSWLISDSCSWTLRNPEAPAGYSDTWSLSLSYDTIARAPDGASPAELAGRGFQLRRAALNASARDGGALFASKLGEYEPKGIGDEAYYVYGTAAEDPAAARMIVVLRSEGTFIEVRLEGARHVSENYFSVVEEPVDEGTFRSIVRNLGGALDKTLDRQIQPEET